MKIAVVGPGAMGLLFASFLKRSGEDVLLFDKDPERASKITQSGISVEGISGEFKSEVRCSSKPDDLKDRELILICVKSYDTKKAALEIKGSIKNDAFVMTLQNGVGNIEELSQALGPDKVIGGVTNHGATLLGIGRIRHAGIGDTAIGPCDKNIAMALTKAGFKTDVVTNITDLIWSKLIINVGINALTAITQLNNGRLIEFEGTHSVMRGAVREACEVAKKKGIKLIYDDPLKKVEEVCVKTAKNVSSMLQDVLKKRKTEIDYINGAIVKEAKAFGINVPVNEALTGLVKTIEESYAIQVK